MFAAAPPRKRGMLGTAFAQLRLIYTITVHNLRSEDRNPVVGLLMVVVASVLMILGFVAMFYIVGVRRSPLRGDFLLYIVSGIFLFQAHTMACSAVTSAGTSGSAIMKHGPMNTAVVITAAALAALYKTLFSAFVLMGLYWLIKPFTLEYPLASLLMLILAWFSGAAVGMVFLSIRPWSPKAAKILSTFYQRIQMLLSGKMFVANALPPFLLHWFQWNPLFHLIDQLRGFMFVNYIPQHTSVTYAVYFSLAVMMVGLMGEFVTRHAESASWSAGR